MSQHDIYVVFHYQGLHNSDYYLENHGDRKLPNVDKYTDCLVRLPFHLFITPSEQQKIIDLTLIFLKTID